MEMTEDILITKTSFSTLEEANLANPVFGEYISDHMFICDYAHGDWQQPEIVPFANLSLSPATLALHYGQSVFEGLKAFWMTDGSLNIFRMDKHYERLTSSLDRMCMPLVPKDLFMEAVRQLVAMDKEWIPKNDGGSLYLRPLVFASEARFGVKIADKYKFIIFTGPVGAYYQKPVKVKVERRYNRAPQGGAGYAKCAGNYGGAFYPTKLAKEQGYDQVLWTDATTNEYIEESGMMNAMFVIDGKLLTPPLSDSILDGITRGSLLQLAADMGVPTEEKPIAVADLKKAFEEKTITEAFGAGTAAVVAPIATINIDGTDYDLPGYHDNNIMFLLKNKLEAIRYGVEADPYGWNHIIKAGG